MKMQPMLEKQFGKVLLHGIGTFPASPMSIDADIPIIPSIGTASAVGAGIVNPAHKNAPRTRNMNKRRISPNRIR